MWKFLGISLSLIFLAACGSSSNEPTELTFDMSNAVGIVKMASSGIDGVKTDVVPSLDIVDEGSASQDSFQKLSAEGQLQPFYDGDLNINDTFIAPDNTVYLLLAEKSTYLRNHKSETCVLLKVNRDDSYSCVDDTLASVQETCFFDGDTDVLGYCTDPIQFDASSAIYYVGTDDSGFKVFRKSTDDGRTVSDIITADTEVYGYIVMPDGTIYFYGRTKDTGLYWLRRLDTHNSLTELEGTDSAIEWMKIFPDNKLYVGSTLYGVDGFLGTFIINPAAGAIEKKCWIEAGTSWLIGPTAKYNKCDPANPLGFSVPFYKETALCIAAGLEDPCLADMFTHQLYTSPANTVYSTLGQLDQKLWTLYPTPKFVNLTKILDISVMEGWAGHSYLAIAGKNTSGIHKFILYNITSGSETDLLPSTEIEIYHAKFSGFSNLWFDGLRFSDNTYVVGVIHIWPISADVSKQADGDEPNPSAEVLSTTPVPITDMQLFTE